MFLNSEPKDVTHAFFVFNSGSMSKLLDSMRFQLCSAASFDMSNRNRGGAKFSVIVRRWRMAFGISVSAVKGLAHVGTWIRSLLSIAGGNVFACIVAVVVVVAIVFVGGGRFLPHS